MDPRSPLEGCTSRDHDLSHSQKKHLSSVETSKLSKVYLWTDFLIIGVCWCCSRTRTSQPFSTKRTAGPGELQVVARHHVANVDDDDDDDFFVFAFDSKVSSERRRSCQVHLGRPSTKTCVATGICVRSHGAGCSA